MQIIKSITGKGPYPNILLARHLFSCLRRAGLFHSAVTVGLLFFSLSKKLLTAFLVLTTHETLELSYIEFLLNVTNLKEQLMGRGGGETTTEKDGGIHVAGYYL